MDPFLLAVLVRFSYRRLWSRGAVVWTSAQTSSGAWVNACGRDATDALATLLARAQAQTGGVDA